MGSEKIFVRIGNLVASRVTLEYRKDGLKVGPRVKSAIDFRGWLKNWIVATMPELEEVDRLMLSKVLALDSGNFSRLSDRTYNRLLLDRLPETLQVFKNVSYTDVQKMKDLLPCMDIRTSEMKMFDPKHNRISEFSFDFWKIAERKDLYAKKMESICPAQFIYDPNQSTALEIVDVENSKVNKFNLHYPPKWKEMEGSGKLPDLAKRFFIHLFPNDEVRHFVYCWMYHMINSRAQTFLYLPTPQGVGKTTFAYLCGSLVGNTNFEMSKDDFASTRFNSFLDRKRLILLDEFNCWGHAQKETLKRVINDRVQIEAKGFDQKTVENHCSFIICNNNAEGVIIDPEDRRFSVPETTSEKLSKSFSEREIKELVKLCTKDDSQFVADIGHWILKKFKDNKYHPTDPWKKSKFESVVVASSREGYKFVLDQIIGKKSSKYLYSKLRSEYRALISKNSPFPHYFKIKEYFTGLKIDGKAIVSIRGEGLNLELIPTKEYMPNVDKGSEDDF